MGIYLERRPILSPDFQNCLSSKVRSTAVEPKLQIVYTWVQMREGSRGTKRHKSPRPTPSSLECSPSLQMPVQLFKMSLGTVCKAGVKRRENVNNPILSYTEALTSYHFLKRVLYLYNSALCLFTKSVSPWYPWFFPEDKMSDIVNRAITQNWSCPTSQGPLTEHGLHALWCMHSSRQPFCGSWTV